MTLVRAAVAADVDRIAELEAEAFPHDPWLPGYLAEAVAGALYSVAVLVAELDAVVVGHAITSTVYEVAELQRIAVTGSARRRGVASRLLDAVQTRAATAGAERLLLEVRDDNAGAMAFYEAAGFAEIDRRAKYYSDGATAIVYQLDLTGADRD